MQGTAKHFLGAALLLAACGDHGGGAETEAPTTDAAASTSSTVGPTDTTNANTTTHTPGSSTNATTGQGIENRLQFIFNVQPSGPEFGEGTGWIERDYEDVWHCAQWHVDAAEQSYALYYDSEELFSFTNGPGNFTETEIPDSDSTVTLGWTNDQTAPPGFTAWSDDFAIDDERIGCGD